MAAGIIEGLELIVHSVFVLCASLSAAVIEKG